MARLARAQPGHSFLRGPQAVDPAPLNRTRAYFQVAVEAPLDRVRRAPSSSLRAPTAVAGALVFGPEKIDLAHPRPRWQARSRLSQPAVVAGAAVFPAAKTTFARALPGDPRRKAQYDLAAPIVIFPGGQLGGIGASLADAPNARSDGRRKAHSKLSAPAIAAVVSVFIAAPVRIGRAASHRPAAPDSRLRPPTIVAGATVYTGPPRVFTEPHRPPATRWRLQPPAAVDGALVFRPIAVALTEPHKPAPTHSRLFPPAVITPISSFVASPVRITRTPSHRPAATKNRLAGPTAVAGALVFDPPDIRLAKIRQTRPLGRWKLSPPQVVTPIQFPPVETTVQVTLAGSADPRRHFAKPRLFAPTVVTAQFAARAIKITLALASRLGRRTRSRLATPPVVSVDTPPVTTQFAPSSRLARAPHPKLRPPIVVGPAVVYRPPVVKLAGRTRIEMAKHASHFRLRAPTVVVDISFTEPFDQPTPTGRPGSSPTHGDYDYPTATGRASSSPTSGAFDIPVPIGEVDIPDPEI